MQFDELRQICQEAARDLLSKEERPLPPAVVLPRAESTQVLLLPEFPDDDEDRLTVMAHLADEQLSRTSTPAYGFIAEGVVGDGVEVVLVAFGARRHAPQITAAMVLGQGLAEFEPAEELDPHAFPFLHPLQRAVDALPAEDGGPGPGPEGGLPLIG